MWGVLTAILLFLLLSFGVWRSFTSGMLRGAIEFTKLSAKVESDMFDGETKTFVLERNGKEKAVKIKTVNDAWDSIISPRESSGSLYFGLKRENSLHLDFSSWSSGGVGMMTLIEKDGNKIIKEDEYNLEEKGLLPAIYTLVDLIERMSSTSTV
ncbi:MAG: hypothetical protein ACKVHH_04075 [Candidatus Poseidoniales archaeon]